MAQECEFFLEIFEFKIIYFEDRIMVQGLKPSRKVKAASPLYICRTICVAGDKKFLISK